MNRVGLLALLGVAVTWFPSTLQAFVPTPHEACCLEIVKSVPADQIELCRGRDASLRTCEEVVRNMSAAAQRSWSQSVSAPSPRPKRAPIEPSPISSLVPVVALLLAIIVIAAWAIAAARAKSFARVLKGVRLFAVALLTLASLATLWPELALFEILLSNGGRLGAVRESLFLGVLWMAQAMGVLLSVLNRQLLRSAGPQWRFIRSFALLVIATHVVCFFLTFR